MQTHKPLPATTETSPPKVVVWGTYDLGKPRVRILLRALELIGNAVIECHADVWRDIEDKSQLRTFAARVRVLVHWLTRYPKLIYTYARSPDHHVVFVPYMGHLDVLLIWPFARFRGKRIVWDAFISLYNTVVEDRQLVSARNPLAWLLYAVEWLATRAADVTILDTEAHAAYFASRYKLSPGRLAAVFVGVEPERFSRLASAAKRKEGEPLVVLFYGQFTPLHGLPTILDAARRLDDGSVLWLLIGDGQEAPSIQASLQCSPIKHLEWRPWVPYEELVEWIDRADVCLGIFAASGKAARVIPNKVFQVVSAGRPLITRESEAIRELFPEAERGLILVPPEDPDALAAAVRRMRQNSESAGYPPLFAGARERFTIESISTTLARVTMPPRGAQE